MPNTQEQLAKAFELIRNDELEKAIVIVKPITESEPDNADAWWLLANAASEARDARRALVNVLKINPSYPKARNLLDTLNEMHPPRDDELIMLMEIQDTEEPPPLPTTLPEADEEDDFLFDEESSGRGIDIEGLFSTDDDVGEASPGMFPRGGADDFGLSEDVDPFADLLDDDSPRAKKARRGGRGRIFVRLLVLILVVVLLGVLVLVFLGGGDESDGGDTPVEAVVVAAADVNVDAAGTLEDVRQAAESEARISGLGNDAVAEFEKQGDGFALVIRFCTQPTPQLQQLVMNAMELIARRVGTTPAIQEFLAGVGINAQDCARNNDILFRASSPMAAVVALTNNPGTGGDSLAVFRQSWTVEN